MMHRPVLVTPPADPPVTLAEVKLALRVDFNDDDARLADEILAAVAYYEGWAGVLGRCLGEQEWRQDFDCIKRELWLPLGPVIDIVSVEWRNQAGVSAPIDPANYALLTDGGGRSYVRFLDAAILPSDLYEIAAVSVNYTAGYPTVDGKSTVPADIKAAIKFRVQLHYDEASSADQEYLERVEVSLISKYRQAAF
jgi:uncharacterized phiE125 gp8 family phage protein